MESDGKRVYKPRGKKPKETVEKRVPYNLRKRTASSSIPPFPRFHEPPPPPPPPRPIAYPGEPRSCLASDQLNALIVKYLKESGFSHTVYDLEHELQLNNISINESSIPTGALVSILEKGFRYVEMEANMDSNDADVDDDYFPLEPINIATTDVHRLTHIVNDKKEKAKELGNRFGKDIEHVQAHRRGDEGPSPMDFTPSLVSPNCEVSDSDVYVFKGHDSEVIACAWSPSDSLLASGKKGNCLQQVLLKGKQIFGGRMDNWRRRSKNIQDLFSLYNGTREVIFSSLEVLTTLQFSGTLTHGSVSNSLHFIQGHVNAIQFDPTGTLLASCSDDRSVKIWSLAQGMCLHNLQEHNEAVFAIKWSPTGPGTSNPDKQLVLASASVDSTIKLWDAQQGHLLRTLNGHREAVYSIAFSPSGNYLASGSLDQHLHIWSMKDGNILKTYSRGGAIIFHVSWCNRQDDKIVAGFANGAVTLIDFRMQ